MNRPFIPPFIADREAEKLPDSIVDALSILNGSFRPWELDSQIASQADWRFYAQCALDGDATDLALILKQLETYRSAMVLPDNEDWRSIDASFPGALV